MPTKEEFFMKIGKRQLILTGLVLALGTAVYLNWQFSANSDLLQGADTVSVSKELGQAEFVNTSVSQKSNAKEKSTQKPTQKSADKATQPTENIAQTSNMIPEPTASAKTEEKHHISGSTRCRKNIYCQKTCLCNDGRNR